MSIYKSYKAIIEYKTYSIQQIYDWRIDRLWYTLYLENSSPFFDTIEDTHNYIDNLIFNNKLDNLINEN